MKEIEDCKGNIDPLDVSSEENNVNVGKIIHLFTFFFFFVENCIEGD